MLYCLLYRLLLFPWIDCYGGTGIINIGESLFAVASIPLGYMCLLLLNSNMFQL